jgi:peptidyl-prolyl cis-trans isomerase C
MIASTLTRRLAAAALLLGLFVLPAAAQEAAPAKPDTVVAEVDGEKITLGDLLTTYRSLPARLQQLPFQQLYRPLLEHVISIRLLAQEGRKLKLQDSADVKRRLAYMESQFVYEAYVDKIVSQQATDAKLKEAYQGYVKTYKGKEEIRASHILVKSEDEAKEIIRQLDKGADFAKLAKEKSIDPSKDRNGGDLGYFTRDQMVKEFADAAFALKNGETTKAPVKTQFGWHVIRVTDRRTEPAPPFDKVKDQLRRQLAEKIAQDEIKRLRDGAKITRFDASGKPLKEEEEKK